MKEKIKAEIERLKREKNAVILAHYYAPSEAQELADYTGDSFYLAKVAKESTASILVFCGVSFMGESAKILNPDKKVLMPDLTADCPMAHMVAPGKIAQMRAEYEDLAVVCYINSTAALKCESDVCVTSSNALKIVRALPNRNIFFIPDRNLGRFVAEQVPEKNVILNDGCCPIHAEISAEALRRVKALHPEAPVLSHPECEPEILALSDFIGSTSDIIAAVGKLEAETCIICTETGVRYAIEAACPEKTLLFPSEPCCPGMKKNTLERLCRVLETGEHAVEVEAGLREGSLPPLDRMLELAR
jgi:quinolinate synthase